MMDGLGITGPMLILLVVAGLAQVLLQVVALVSLYRVPVVTFGNKWVWVAIIVLLGFMGALVFLIVGRQPVAVKEPEYKKATAVPDDATQRTRSAADLLYGGEEEK